METTSHITDDKFYDGGINRFVDREFLSKLIDAAKLTEKEMTCITECVMLDRYKSSLAKDMGIAPDTVSKTITRAIKKIQKTFDENRISFVGRDHTMIIDRPAINIDELIAREKKKNSKEWVDEDHHGTKHWYKGHLLHREGAPAVVQKNGGQAWFYYGIRHRDDGPAIEYADGSKEWWIMGKRHRQIGYAVEHADGKRQKWLYGNKIYEDSIK